MFKEVLFSGSEGHGIISDSRIEVESVVCVHAEPIVIGDTSIGIGTKTDLEGFFKRQLEYVGFLISPQHKPSIMFLEESANKSYSMVFYIGEHEGEFYYQIVFRISETRFYIHYKKNGGRDYNRVNGIWCFNRPKKKPKK